MQFIFNYPHHFPKFNVNFTEKMKNKQVELKIIHKLKEKIKIKNVNRRT